MGYEVEGKERLPANNYKLRLNSLSVKPAALISFANVVLFMGIWAGTTILIALFDICF
jgi:hypothetical protein